MKLNLSKLQLSFNFAVKALAENKFRAMLTALGIIFGVAAVIAMLAIGKGAEQEIMEQIKRVGSNNIIVQKKLLNEGKEEGDGSKKEYILSNGLTLDDISGMEEVIPGIDKVSPELAYESFVMYGSRSSDLRLVGVGAEYFDMFNYILLEGKFFASQHVVDSKPVCVIGQSVKKKIFANEDPIGKKIKCGNIWFEVLGVIKTSSSEDNSEILGIRDPDDDIYLPITSMLLRYKNKNLITKKVVEQNNSEDDEENGATKEAVDYHQIDKIIIQIKQTEQLKQIANIVSRYLYRTHAKTFDFEIHIPELLLKQQQRSKAIFNIVLGVIAGISLLVGGIGIMNIMLASVMERIKEIGVRMAIGASEKDIVLQFVLESVVLSLSGGIAGIFLGMIISFAIEQITGILTIITFFSVVLSFGVSVLIGIVFGIMPAKRAAKQDPVVSLRN